MRVRPMGTRHLDVGKEGPEGVAAGDGVQGHEGRGGQEEAHRQRQHLPEDLGAGHTGDTGDRRGWGRGEGAARRNPPPPGEGRTRGSLEGSTRPPGSGEGRSGEEGGISRWRPLAAIIQSRPDGGSRAFFWSHLIFLSLARHWGKNGNQSVTTSLGDPLRFPFEREKKKIRRRFSISSSPPPRREVPEPGPGASWLRSREETSYSPLPREGNLSKAI